MYLPTCLLASYWRASRLALVLLMLATCGSKDMLLQLYVFKTPAQHTSIP